MFEITVRDPGLRWPEERPWMVSHLRWSQRLREHLAAGAVAGTAVGVLDALMAVDAAGLAPLSPAAVDGVFSLVLLLWLATGLLGGLAVSVLMSLAERGLGGHLELMAVAHGRPLRRTLALLVALGVVLVGLRIFLKPVEWEAVPWSIVFVLMAGSGLYLCGMAAAQQGPRTALAIISLGVLGCLAPSVPSAHDPQVQDEVIGRISEQTMSGRTWLPMARGLFDEDEDGFPTRLCAYACDCDDGDPGISPGSLEIADNGVDEDCSGEDLSLADLESFRFVAEVEPRETLMDEEPEPSPRGPLDIVFVVVDTLRADHLGLYGYHKDLTPNLDAFSEDTLVFDQARATGSQTRFSVPPMMVGKYFTELDRTRGQWPAVGEHEKVISERLKEAGYHTAAFHSIAYMRKHNGLAQGFDHYDESLFTARPNPRWGPSSDYITDQALAYAEEGHLDGEEPFFLWIYYSDPHSPYKCYEPFKHLAGDRKRRYDCEIAYTDHHLGRLLDGFEERGLFDNALFVLASDHGEGLDEEEDHGSLYHGPTLYDEVVRVPLLMRMPDGVAGRTRVPVSLIDLAPTFVEAAGLPPASGLRGVSLMPYLRGEDPPHPPVFFEKHKDEALPQKGMVAWPYKVIRKLPWGRPLIYDLSRDPKEKRNIRGQLSDDERERLEGMLSYWISTLEEGVLLASRLRAPK